jgi:hypothetical protein
MWRKTLLMFKRTRKGKRIKLNWVQWRTATPRLTTVRLMINRSYDKNFLIKILIQTTIKIPLKFHFELHFFTFRWRNTVLIILLYKGYWLQSPWPCRRVCIPPHFVFSTNDQVFGGILFVSLGFPPYWNNVFNSLHPPVPLYISWTKPLSRFLWSLIWKCVNQKLSRHAWVFDSCSFQLFLRLKINIEIFL